MMKQMAANGEANSPAEDQTGLTGLAPRVTISGFCDDPQTLDTVRQALLDRRMARTHGSLHEGGIDAAIEYCSTEVTPNVMIIETRLEREPLFRALNELAELCDAGTKVILVGPTNDVALYRDLMRHGVSEYLVTPVTSMQLIEAVLGLFSDPEGGRLGRLISFFGAKGGAGSSTISHNVGWMIAERLDDDVIIADFDLPFGTAGLDFNTDPAQGIADALNAPERIDDLLIDRLLTKCSERLSLLTAPGQLDGETKVDEGNVEKLLSALRSSAPYVIADLPHQWTAWTRHVLHNSDEVVITATPDLAGLRNTKQLVDWLKASRPNDLPPRVVLNQTGIPKRSEISVQEFTRVCGIESPVVVGFDGPLFMNATNNGQMLSQISPNAKAVETIGELATVVSGRKIPAKRSFFSLKLFGSGKLKRKGA